MKVFLSWSGEESKWIAAALRKWIRNVLQSAEPWMSERDIATGARWSQSIAANLRLANVGVICLTPENIAAPWLHFEAGALSKAVDDTYICPLLTRVEPSQLVGPMSQFQAQRFGRDGVFGIMQTIRLHPEYKTKLPDAAFVDTFNKWWPELEDDVAAAPRSTSDSARSRKPEEMIPEILEQVRALSRQMHAEPFQNSDTKLDTLRRELSTPTWLGMQPPEHVRAVPPADLIDRLLRWDSTLAQLLGGEGTVRAIVDEILGGHVGEATTKVMSAAKLDLPRARSFVDSLLIAITRMSENDARFH